MAVGDVVKGVVAAGVQAGGHGGDFGNSSELRVLFLVEHLHVGGVLVNVEVDAALVQGNVGLFEHGKILVFNLIALVLQYGGYGVFE